MDCEKVFATTPRCHQGGITTDTMSAVGAPVSDDTGLTGTYGFQLRWSNEVAPGDDVVDGFERATPH